MTSWTLSVDEVGRLNATNATSGSVQCQCTEPRETAEGRSNREMRRTRVKSSFHGAKPSSQKRTRKKRYCIQCSDRKRMVDLFEAAAEASAKEVSQCMSLVDLLPANSF